jgi:hypothetical protein
LEDRLGLGDVDDRAGSVVDFEVEDDAEGAVEVAAAEEDADEELGSLRHAFPP